MKKFILGACVAASSGAASAQWVPAIRVDVIPEGDQVTFSIPPGGGNQLRAQEARNKPSVGGIFYAVTVPETVEGCLRLSTTPPEGLNTSITLENVGEAANAAQALLGGGCVWVKFDAEINLPN